MYIRMCVMYMYTVYTYVRTWQVVISISAGLLMISDLNSDLSWMNPCRATFCGSDGKVYTASLNSLAIDFSD